MSDLRADLLLDVHFTSVDSRQAFSAAGGRLDAASAPLFAVIHVSGNKQGVRVLLDRAEDMQTPLSVRVPLDAAEVVHMPDGSAQTWLPGDSRIAVQFVSKSFTLSGSIGAAALGEENRLLLQLFQEHGGNAVVPLKYSSAWQAARAHVGLFSARVETFTADEAGRRTLVRSSGTPYFRPEVDFMDAVPRLQQHLQDVADEGLAMRRRLVFEPQPNLSKTLASAVGGLAGSQYAPLGAMLDHGVSLSLEGIDRALDFGMRLELATAPEGVDAAMEKALQRLHALAGSDAEGAPSFEDETDAAYGVAVAVSGAMSSVAASLMSYRVDGAPVVMPAKNEFRPAEKWSAQAQQFAGVECDDCDRSATLLHNLVLEIQRSGERDRARLPVLGAVASMLDHYTATLVVLGASSPEASGGAEHEGGVAGHAIALLQPKQDFVRAVLSGAALNASALSGARGGAAAYAELLWRELYPPELTARMRGTARSALERSYEAVARSGASMLPVLALEGTTPSSGLLFDHDAARRRQSHARSLQERSAAAGIGDSVGRPLKSLAALGASDDVHGFYLAMVEATVGWNHPTYGSPALRDALGAVDQFVFTCAERDGGATAGATPKDVALGSYQMVPLVVHGRQRAADFDVLGTSAARDVFPPTREAARIDEQSSARVRALVDALGRLDANGASVASDAGLTYVLPINAMLMNETFTTKSMDALVPLGARVFVQRVPGILKASDGEELGVFAAISV